MPLIYTDEVGSWFYCLSVCKVMCPEFSGILSSSVSLGLMPLALALASGPLFRVLQYGGVPSSAALTLAAVAPLVAPQVSELESSTLPSVMPSQSRADYNLGNSTFICHLDKNGCNLVSIRKLEDFILEVQQIDQKRRKGWMRGYGK